MSTPKDTPVDDLGHPFTAPPPTRVVSLVPSTTETVEAAVPGLIVGATDYCTHPAGLDVPRVGGSKYPRIADVLDLAPDLVLANAEENRKGDVEALRAAGTPVWVSYPRTVPGACRSAARMFTDALGVAEPPWIAEAVRLWAGPAPTRFRAAIPIWRRPWMVLGAGTFAGDVLSRLGVANVYDDADAPYPKVTVADVVGRRPDVVVLPDEPYEFTRDDGPEAFGGLPCALVSGRHLTWHGPSLVEAHAVLSAALAPENRLRV